MATRNCPIGAAGIVQKWPRTVVTSIRHHPSIRRALPITAGRHTGAHEVAMYRPGPGDRALPLRQRSVHRRAASITPALLTSVSRRPSSETVCSTASVASSCLVTSHSMTSAVPPASPISLASVSGLSLRLAARATAAPVAESWRAVAAPIPRCSGDRRDRSLKSRQIKGPVAGERG